MINAKELKIGNKIIYNGVITDVTSITDKGINLLVLYKDDKLVFEVLEFLQIAPIPLTPEILESAGFEIHSMGGHYNEIFIFNYVEICTSDKVSKFKYCYCYHRDENGKKYFRGLNFLHELQNLYFTLTGQELEINLNDEDKFETNPITGTRIRIKN